MNVLKRFSIVHYAVLLLIIANCIFVFMLFQKFWGIDFHLLLQAADRFLGTGNLYDKTFNYNAPPAILMTIPFLFFPAPLIIKISIQALCVLGGVLVIFRIVKENILHDNAMLFLIVCMILTFLYFQFVTLNIYLEVMLLLVLSLYFYLKGHETASAFFLSMAIVIKIFLLPLIIAPLLAKEYRLLIKVSGFFLILFILSLAVFGIHTHLDFLRSFIEFYPQKRLDEIKNLFLSSGWCGYQDFYNKLYIRDYLTREAAAWLTSITAILYVSIFVYAIRIIYRISGTIESDKDRKIHYIKVFGSILILSLVFNFRYDHGAMLLAVLPFIAKINDPGIRKKICYSMVVAGFLNIGWITLLEMTTLFEPSTIESMIRFFDVFSFTFIGINLVLFFVIQYWHTMKIKPA